MPFQTYLPAKALAGFLFAALLSGCQLSSGGLSPAGADRLSGPPPARMSTAGGMLVVSGPEGFCIDRAASRSEPSGSALVVLLPCRALGASRFSRSAAQQAVMTAAVAARPRVVSVSEIEPVLRSFFASRDGRAMLSRAGDARSVVLHKSYAEGGVYYLHLSDRAPFRWGDVQADYWRALLPAGGRMVTLSVLALPGEPLSEAEGLALLREFAAAVQAGSALPAGPEKL